MSTSREGQRKGKGKSVNHYKTYQGICQQQSRLAHLSRQGAILEEGNLSSDYQSVWKPTSKPLCFTRTSSSKSLLHKVSFSRDGGDRHADHSMAQDVTVHLPSSSSLLRILRKIRHVTTGSHLPDPGWLHLTTWRLGGDTNCVLDMI